MGEMADWLNDWFELYDLYYEDDPYYDPNLEAQIIFAPYVERNADDCKN